MPGSYSRLRERVGVRVFACRQGFVSHEKGNSLHRRGAEWTELRRVRICLWLSVFALCELCANSANSVPLR